MTFIALRFYVVRVVWGKNSEATNEVTEDNVKALKEFLRAVEQLYKDKSTIKNLGLETKAA